MLNLGYGFPSASSRLISIICPISDIQVSHPILNIRSPDAGHDDGQLHQVVTAVRLFHGSFRPITLGTELAWPPSENLSREDFPPKQQFFHTKTASGRTTVLLAQGRLFGGVALSPPWDKFLSTVSSMASRIDLAAICRSLPN